MPGCCPIPEAGEVTPIPCQELDFCSLVNIISVVLIWISLIFIWLNVFLFELFFLWNVSMTFFFFIFFLTNFRNILYILDTNLCSCVFAEFVVQSLGRVTMRPHGLQHSRLLVLHYLLGRCSVNFVFHFVFYSMFSVPRSVFVLYIDLYYSPGSTYKWYMALWLPWV